MLLGAAMKPRLFDGEHAQELVGVHLLGLTAAMKPRLFDGEHPHERAGRHPARIAAMKPRLFDGEHPGCHRGQGRHQRCLLYTSPSPRD